MLLIYSLAHGHYLGGEPLEETETFPSPTTASSHRLWWALFQDLCRNFKELSVTASYLNYFFGAGALGWLV